MRIQMVKNKERLCFHIGESISFYYLGRQYIGIIAKMHVVNHYTYNIKPVFYYIILVTSEYINEHDEKINRYFIIVYTSRTNRKPRAIKFNRNCKCIYSTTSYDNAKTKMENCSQSYKSSSESNGGLTLVKIFSPDNIYGEIKHDNMD